MDLVNPKIDDYLDDLSSPEHPVLKEMETLARERSFPIIGSQVGSFLLTMTKAIGARRVLELGSGFGYSAFYFAKAVGVTGTVVLTELSEEHAEEARGFLARAGLDSRIQIEIGDGLELARAMEGPFDVIFNDVEKEDYPASFEIARNLLRPGGLFICDNMLWYGRVLESEPADDATRGVQELTRTLQRADDFSTTFIPMRDGLSVSVKLK